MFRSEYQVFCKYIQRTVITLQSKFAIIQDLLNCALNKGVLDNTGKNMTVHDCRTFFFRILCLLYVLIIWWLMKSHLKNSLWE